MACAIAVSTQVARYSELPQPMVPSTSWTSFLKLKTISAASRGVRWSGTLFKTDKLDSLIARRPRRSGGALNEGARRRRGEKDRETSGLGGYSFGEELKVRKCMIGIPAAWIET